MRTISAALGLAASVASCTISVRAQTKYVPQSPLVITAQTPWKNQAIDVTNTNGSVSVVGDPSASTVSLSAVPFAFADTQADADAAVEDVTATIALEESATRFYVRCDLAAKDHGSSVIAGTGCALKVTIPIGTAAQGVPLTVSVRTGPTTVENVVGSVVVLAEEGSVTANGITGNCRAHTASGEMSASVTPTLGAVVEVWTENGSATLALPASFATDRLSILGQGGTVTITGFNGLDSGATMWGAAGTGASSVSVISSAGNATLRAQ